jgi:uncharacterized protein YbbC (DUF1343 family)
MRNSINYLLLIVSLILLSCCSTVVEKTVTGDERADVYKPLISGASVAVVANQASMAGKVQIVTKLKSEGVDLRVIFAPEHGFREMAEAGAEIHNGNDPETGTRIVSLYGDHFKPSEEDLKGIDVVLFDIQDVGTRFYTYISTLHYVMEACAENNVRCIVLDRPDPNGFYVDGNIADTNFRSFVGMDPVPVVHGMTVGEYAGMVNGEGWLKDGLKCDLTVIKCLNYSHSDLYELNVPPSPNLPNQTSVYLYPSLCFFEGTNISVGRGTDFPFQVYGSPLLPDRGFSFLPESRSEAKNPPFEGVKCFGTDLRNAIGEKLVPLPQINLEWFISAYNDYPEKDKFFNSYFDVLASGPILREQIRNGMSAEEIRASWKDGLDKFRKIRERYLLYR